MKIKAVYVENRVREFPVTTSLLQQLPPATPVYEIQHLSTIFGKVRKPYLDKRRELYLFIAANEGKAVKLAPAAYGKNNGNDPHYYFIHFLNCIYECHYCYLQGHFNSPDLVYYVNHQDILREMEATLHLPENKDSKVWFHAGEFSDSLALTHLTNEWAHYFPFFAKYPQAHLELRTKSVHITPLLKLTPTANVIVSFSLSTQSSILSFDQFTPPLKSRLQAISRLFAYGYEIGIHLDPIVPLFPNPSQFWQEARELFSQILTIFPGGKKLRYLSLGVLRYPDKSYRSVKHHYPQSLLHTIPMKRTHTGPENKWRPSAVGTQEFLGQMRNLWLDLGGSLDPIYFCMEDECHFPPQTQNPSHFL